jgi:hypothetical protein
LAIASRDSRGLIALLRSECILDDFSGLKSAFNVLELALGWTLGIKLLLESGCQPFAALHFAIRLGDTSSFNFLITHDCPLFVPPKDSFKFWKAGMDDSMELVRSSNCTELITQYIDALRQRRQGLKRMALQHLTSEELHQFHLNDNAVLDANSLSIYSMLIEKRVSIPKSFYPGERPTVYHRLENSRRSEEETTTPTFESLFSKGFIDFDAKDQNGCTPLLSIARMSKWTNGTIDDFGWLLDRGASLEFSTLESFQHFLFYHAIQFSSMLRSSSGLNHAAIARLVSKSCPISNSTVVDACICFCSSKGCNPIHFLNYCSKIEGISHSRCNKMNRKVLDQTLEKWIELYDVDNIASTKLYLEVCRQEIFNRLGMTHTCCSGVQSSETIRRKPFDSDEERTVIQSRETPLKQQLDLIMSAYEALYLDYHGSVRSFWRSWWNRLDEILPDMLPVQRCNQHLLSWIWISTCEEKDLQKLEQIKAEATRLTAMNREEALKKAGYEGLDFSQVIQRHFGGLLDTSRLPEDERDISGVVEQRRNSPLKKSGAMSKMPRPRIEGWDSIRSCLVCNHLDIKETVTIKMALLHISSSLCYSCKLLESITNELFPQCQEFSNCEIALFPESRGLPFHLWISTEPDANPNLQIEVFLPNG